MNEIIVSIKPEWIKKIADGKKTIEVRKSAPKDVPFKAYIYATESSRWALCFDRSEDAYEKVCLTANCRSKEISAKNYNLEIVSGYIVGEFICEAVENLCNLFEGERPYHLPINGESCLTLKEIEKYGQSKRLYGWRIKDLVIYDEPKKLTDFYKKCNGHCFNGCSYYRGKDEDCDKPVFTRPPQSWCYTNGQTNM